MILIACLPFVAHLVNPLGFINCKKSSTYIDFSEIIPFYQRYNGNSPILYIETERPVYYNDSQLEFVNGMPLSNKEQYLWKKNLSLDDTSLHIKTDVVPKNVYIRFSPSLINEMVPLSRCGDMILLTQLYSEENFIGSFQGISKGVYKWMIPEWTETNYIVALISSNKRLTENLEWTVVKSAESAFDYHELLNETDNYSDLVIGYIVVNNNITDDLEVKSVDNIEHSLQNSIASQINFIIEQLRNPLYSKTVISAEKLFEQIDVIDSIILDLQITVPEGLEEASEDWKSNSFVSATQLIDDV